MIGQSGEVELIAALPDQIDQLLKPAPTSKHQPRELRRNRSFGILRIDQVQLLILIAQSDRLTTGAARPPPENFTE